MAALIGAQPFRLVIPAFTLFAPLCKPCAVVHNCDMDEALTLLDGMAGVGVLFSGIIGVYWQLVRRVDSEVSARVSLGKDLGHVAEDVAKLSATQEKLVRREHRREGAAMAARGEPSGVQDMPRHRVHVGTDTTL